MADGTPATHAVQYAGDPEPSCHVLHLEDYDASVCAKKGAWSLWKEPTGAAPQGLEGRRERSLCGPDRPWDRTGSCRAQRAHARAFLSSERSGIVPHAASRAQNGCIFSRRDAQVLV